MTQARTILGPLTTTWTPPPSCTNAVEGCPTCTAAYQAQKCYSSSINGKIVTGAEDNTDCWPPRASFVPTRSPPFEGWGLYSPGLICPTGYTSACSATGGGTSGWALQFGLLTKETAIGCCPSGYFCAVTGVSSVQTCLSQAISTSFPMVKCGSQGTSSTSFLFSVPTTVSSTPISTYAIFPPMFQINFQASDLSTSTSSSISSSASSSGSTSSPTSNASSSATLTISPTSPTNTPALTPTPPSSLSTAAKAGIGVAVSLGIIALVLLTFYLQRRRKHAYGAAPTNPIYELGDKKGSYATPELPQIDLKVGLLPPDEIQRKRPFRAAVRCRYLSVLDYSLETYTLRTHFRFG